MSLLISKHLKLTYRTAELPAWMNNYTLGQVLSHPSLVRVTQALSTANSYRMAGTSDTITITTAPTTTPSKSPSSSPSKKLKVIM
jgi:hypothetical protein